MRLFTRLFRKERARTTFTKRPFLAGDYRITSAALLRHDSTSFNCIDRIASQVAMLNFSIYSRSTRQRIQQPPPTTHCCAVLIWKKHRIMSNIPQRYPKISMPI